MKFSDLFRVTPMLMAELLLSSAAISILGLATSVYSIMILRRYVGLGIDTTLYTLTSGVLLAILFENLLRRARNALLENWQQKRDLRDSSLLLSGFGLSRYEVLEELNPAEKREILAAPSQISQAFSPSNLSAILDAPFACLYLLVLTAACPPIGAMTTLAVFFSLLVSLAGMQILKTPAESVARLTSRAAIIGHFLSQSGETLRAFRALPILKNAWTDSQDASTDARRDLLKKQSVLQQIGAVLASLLSVMTYAIGALQVVAGSLDIGTLIGLSILSSRCFQTFNRITSMSETMAKARRSLKALNRLREMELEPQKGLVPQFIEGHLELISISLSFPLHPLPVFENLNLKIPAGGILAVQGPNGSGKTSLMRLLCGLRSPGGGMMKVDGMELRQIVPDWWRSQVAYVPQDLHFFEGTLKENLTARQPDISDEELLRICALCDLVSFLQSRPEGLGLKIQSQAQDLPAGIRRRMALTRALVGSSQMIFMDEPTEGLDPAGIQAVAAILNHLASQKKTIVIAGNEPFILNSADWVLALENGPGHRLLVREKKE